jgi:hypothetical protein
MELEEQPILTPEEADAVFDVLVDELGCLPALRGAFHDVVVNHGLRTFQFDGWNLSREGDTPKFRLSGQSMTLTQIESPGMDWGDWEDKLTWANIFIEERLLKLRAEPPQVRPGKRGRLSGLAGAERSLA